MSSDEGKPKGGNMLYPWLYNMLGATLSDEDMGNIRHPRLELHTHVLFKTVQMGSMIGLLVVGPARTLLRGPRTLASLWSLSSRSAVGGAMIGVPLGPLMTEMMVRTSKRSDEAGVIDRVYRLRYNRGQCNVDRLSVGGAVVGGVTGGLLSAQPQYGAVAGLCSGVMLAAACNAKSAKKEKAGSVAGVEKKES